MSSDYSPILIPFCIKLCAIFQKHKSVGQLTTVKRSDHINYNLLCGGTNQLNYNFACGSVWV
jgi:hypothetical protein